VSQVLGSLLVIVSLIATGLVLGALGMYRVMIVRVANDPMLFGTFFSNALTGLAERCGRSTLHFVTVEREPVCVPVTSVSHALQAELTTWLEQKRRGLS
jgi:hypothetical protein